jgi:anti-sigma regulatory factor (Ser/Thr protein kinase)
MSFSEDALGLFNLHEAMETLERAGPGPLKVALQFEGETVHVHGLALLAGWLDRHAAGVDVEASSTRTREYLDRVGFLDVARGDWSHSGPAFDDENFVALTRVVRKQRDEANEVAGRIGDLLARHADLRKETVEALKILLAEIIENIYLHSECNFPAYVLAQAHPTSRRVNIAIADTGIGVYDSFRRSDRADMREAVRSPRDALELAVKLVSSKAAQTGYGLYVAYDLTRRNQGAFRLTSGRRTKILRPPGSTFGHPRPVVDHSPWHGTFVGFVLNTDKRWALQDVWDAMPIPEGYERADFF